MGIMVEKTRVGGKETWRVTGLGYLGFFNEFEDAMKRAEKLKDAIDDIYGIELPISVLGD